MRILYCAIDQRIPGPHGGAVHVTAVAEGLAALGHDVCVLARLADQPRPRAPGPRPPAPGPRPQAPGVAWRVLEPPFGVRQARFARASRVEAIAREFRADVIIERYHNFGGEGIRAARRLGVGAVLEVNAPVIDHPGSLKRVLDRLLIAEPMRRWRDWQCAHADLIVTPTAAILPSWVPPERVLVIEWGADTDRFHPAAGDRKRRDEVVSVFAGAFRRWHGAIHLVDAIRRLRDRGRRQVSAIFIGEGPELERTRAAARDLDRVVFMGAIPHADMPACLAGADIGVAPFDAAAHPALALDFYWSPLKVFEYMASGLPVVAPRLERLSRLVRDGVEGVLYDPHEPDALAGALEQLLDPALRARLGAAARARVVEHFSWAAHCRRLEAAIQRLI